MKSLGLIGGTTWHSTLEYYRLLNIGVGERLGSRHSAKLLLHNVDFEELYSLQLEGGSDAVGYELLRIAQILKDAGVDGLLLCANTLHLRADMISQKSGLPVIHIADAVLDSAEELGLSKLLLLGTQFTMEGDVYFTKAKSRGIDMVIPEKEKRHLLNEYIYNEMAAGDFTDQARTDIREMIEVAVEMHADGVAFACTELPILFKGIDIGIPALDTLNLHVSSALDFMLSDHVSS